MMATSLRRLILILIPGFLQVGCNLLMDDPLPKDSMILESKSQTPRPPHRIRFMENGNTVERIVDDETVPMLPMNPGLVSSDFGGRENSPTQISTSSLDGASRDFNANMEDGSKLSIENQELPSVLLTPQRYFHIKVEIPKAYYTTRLSTGPYGDVDIVDIRSIESMVQRANRNVNVNLDALTNTGLRTYNDQRTSFTNQPYLQSSGWSNLHSSSIPVSRTVDDNKQNIQNENSISPSYHMGNPQVSMLSNAYKVADDIGGNNQYGLFSSPLPSEKGVDVVGVQPVPQQYIYTTQYGMVNTSPEMGQDTRGQGNYPYANPAAAERVVDNLDSQNQPQSMQSQISQRTIQGEPNLPQSFSGAHSSPQPLQDVQNIPQISETQNSPIQGVQDILIPQPLQGSHLFSVTQSSPQLVQGVQNVIIPQPPEDSNSLSGTQSSPQPVQGSQNIPPSYQGSHSFSRILNSQQPIQQQSPTGMQNVPLSFQGSHSMAGPLSIQQMQVPSTQFQGQKSSPQSLQKMIQPYQADLIPQSNQEVNRSVQNIQGSENSLQQFRTLQPIPGYLESFQTNPNTPQLPQGGHQLSQSIPSSSGITYEQYRGNPRVSHSYFATTRSSPPSTSFIPDVKDNARQQNMQPPLKAVRSLDDESKS